MDLKIDNILNDIRVGNAFQIFGGLGFLLSIYQNHEIGIKISLVMFIFGGIFGTYNFIRRDHGIIRLKNKYLNFIWLFCYQFLLLIVLLLLFLAIINKHLSIF